MAPYYFLFLGLLASSLASQDRRVYLGLGDRGLFFVLLAMTLLLGLRYGVGNDFHSYERIFFEIEGIDRLGVFVYSLSESTPVESGFALLMLGVKSLTGSYAVFVFILAVLSVVLKYAIFKKISPFLAISFLIYFSDEWFWKDLSGARVALATTFILFGMYYAHIRKPAAFFGFILLAMLCHSASIIALPFYFVRYFSTRFFMTSALMIAIAIAIGGGIGLFVTKMAAVVGMEESSRLLKYANSKYVGEGSFLRGTNLLHIFISLLFIYFYKPLVRKWAYNWLLVPLYVYGTALMFLFVDYGIIWGRIREMLCVPAFVVIAPSFILLFKGNQRLIPYLIIVLYCILFFYLKMRDRVPYQSILGLIG